MDPPVYGTQIHENESDFRASRLRQTLQSSLTVTTFFMAEELIVHFSVIKTLTHIHSFSSMYACEISLYDMHLHGCCGF